MRGRLLTAAVAAALTTTPALAAPAKPCAVTDEDRPGEPSALDIRRAEVAFGARTVVVRLTLDTTDASREPARMLGYRWSVQVARAGRTVSVAYERAAGPADTYRPRSAEGPVRVSVSRTTITWTLDRTAFGPDKKKAVGCAVRATSAVAGLTADDAG